MTLLSACQSTEAKIQRYNDYYKKAFEEKSPKICEKIP